MDYKLIFEALPNVQIIWVTKDGNFHLHEDNGGEKVTRSEAFKVVDKTAKETDVPKIYTQSVSNNQPKKEKPKDGTK